MSKKQMALDRISDLASRYLYYDRKNDEELSYEELKYLLLSEELTIEEIVLEFKNALEVNI